ncbi:MAG: hypothetical protein H8D78_08915 [Chloroflexi bacterium]|nr:hypothetical protein [Chloroflexota bacterium]
MAQTVTLELPHTIYLPARRMAEATDRPLEDLLVRALQASLPPLDGLPAELTEELIELESLGDESLWRVMVSRVPATQQRGLDRLLRKNQAGTLTERERQKLDQLQREADRVMLRKARAAVLLRFRGHRLPTLEELRRLAPQT